MSSAANSRRLVPSSLRTLAASPSMPARSSTPESARVCGEYRASQQAGEIGDLGHQRTEAVEVDLDAIDRILLARELEQRGRVAAGHAGYDCVFACHVDLLFRQFRRLGTVADGGRQALEIQWDFASSRGAAGALRKPTKIARFRNTPPTAVQHDEMPAGNARFADGRPLRERPAPMVHRPSLLLGLPDPARATPRPASSCRRDSPRYAGGGEPGLGRELASLEDRAQRHTAV